MHNYYTLIYNRCVFEVLEQEKGKGNADTLRGRNKERDMEELQVFRHDEHSAHRVCHLEETGSQEYQADDSGAKAP